MRYFHRHARLGWLTVARGSVALAAAGAVFLMGVPEASAFTPDTGGCYASGCDGLDPVGLCSGDAETVASMAVLDPDTGEYEGQLDLRYSPSCDANWGRFSFPYGPRFFLNELLGQPVPSGARVTVWNPGDPSYGPIGRSGVETVWSAMTDGTGLACTGVEVYNSVIPFSSGLNPGSGAAEYTSIGWTWGPCR